MRSTVFVLAALVVFILTFNTLIYDESPLPDQAQLLREVNRYKTVVTGVSFADSNFSDLQVLDSVFKTKRILMLGEMLHSDGETFRAKSRLIRYLHQKLGYEVVLYEAGQYDMWLMNREMEKPELQVPSTALGGIGLFYFWWRNQENKPLISYYQQSKQTADPITLGGFDIQFSGGMLRDKRGQLLDEYFQKQGVDLRAYPVFRKQMQKLDYLSYAGYASKQLDATAQKQFLDELSSLEKAVRSLNKDPQQRIYVRYLSDMKNNFDRSWKHKPGSMTSMHIRDSLMAENLSYQLDSLYADKKVIIWCANIHAFSAPCNKEYTPLGTYIKKKYGQQSYMLGFSSYARFNERGRIVDRPSKLAIENVFHAANSPYFFLDLHSLPAASRLRQPFVSAMNQQQEEQRQWSDFFDGIFYIDINKQPTYSEK
ncbi:erythromycin esterase family protein [Sphingobacterium thalpophilum]|uniref:erythromycin esterase family protein n=1 Tax=Sphingobacterium thalpophilum TaxID=259 RepID=UPI003D9665F3